MSIRNFGYFQIWFRLRDIGSDDTSSMSLFSFDFAYQSSPKLRVNYQFYRYSHGHPAALPVAAHLPQPLTKRHDDFYVDT